MVAAYIYKSRRRGSKNFSKSKKKEHRSTTCYLYNNEHFIRNYLFLRRAQAYIKKLRYFSRKYTKYRDNKKVTKLYYRDRKSFNKKIFSKKRAYNAEISENFNFEIKLNSLNLKEEEDKKTAAILRKAASKISFFNWVADFGVSAYIIN